MHLTAKRVPFHAIYSDASPMSPRQGRRVRSAFNHKTRRQVRSAGGLRFSLADFFRRCGDYGSTYAQMTRRTPKPFASKPQPRLKCALRFASAGCSQNQYAPVPSTSTSSICVTPHAMAYAVGTQYSSFMSALLQKTFCVLLPNWLRRESF